MSEYDFNREESDLQQSPTPERKEEETPPAGYTASRPLQQTQEPNRYPPQGGSAAEGYQYQYQQGHGGRSGYQWDYSRQYDASRSQGSTYGRRSQSPNPYQYSANNGWQQQAKRQDRYEWNFQEYDSLLSGKRRKGKNRGIVIFAISLLCVISVGLLTLTGYNIVRTFTPEVEAGENTSVSGIPQLPDTSAPPQAGGHDEVSMNIADKPTVVENTPQPGDKMTIPQVARAVRPAVVGIVNYQNTQFYEPATEGSGIIISADGFIVTNTHVVEGADGLVVVFDDDTEVEAEVIGLDSRTDLAVIKVDRDDLVPAIFGNSNELEVGETVIAIGNPGGVELAGSVTQGIVSAVNRVVKTPYYSTSYIQTDAAINPGNSGGALCNEFGQVVGINSAKIVAEGYEGIGFAIPITEAIPIIDDLIKNGRVTGRVLLGITGENVGEVIARNRNVPAGVQITGITSEELTKRGVLRGDIITHIDDERVWDINGIQNILQEHKAGDLVKLTLFRMTRITTSSTFDITVPLIEDTGSN